MRKHFSLVLCLLLLVMSMVLAGCGATPEHGSPVEGTEPVENVTSDPATETLAAEQKIVYNAVESASYDPIRDDNSGELTAHLFEGVMTWDNEQIVLGQAQSLEVSADGLTYTVVLRDDIYWSDGEPVTADHFVDAWLRALDPATAAKYVHNLYPIAGAEAYNQSTGSVEEVGLVKLDEKSFAITLAVPSVCFEEILTNINYLPVRLDIVEAHGEAWSLNPATCVSNGPFRMAAYTPAEKMVLVKNEHYYGADEIILEEIEIRFITDSAVELMAYQNGDIQIAVKATSETADQYPDEARYVSRLSTMWLVVNTRNEVLSDARVRRALSLVIDRQAICDYVVGGGVTPAYSIIPEAEIDYSRNMPFVDVFGPYFQENIEEAQQLLAEAGYPGGQGFPALTYGTSSSTEYENVAQAIAAMWKEYLGIDCSIQVEDSSAFISHRKQQGYFDVARYTLGGSYSDPLAMLAYYGSTDSNNDSFFQDAAYDELLARVRSISDLRERFDIYHQMDQILIDEMAVIPLYYPSSIYLIKPEVRGVNINYIGCIEFKSAYVVE